MSVFSGHFLALCLIGRRTSRGSRIANAGQLSVVEPALASGDL